jgi:OOP family OmpA-OmpF porin
VAIALAACPLAALAGEGPYVGAEGGVNWESTQNLHQNSPVIDRLQFNTGWMAGLVGGYSFENGLRPELELNYRRNGFSHDLFGGGSGTDQAGGALANLWYDLKTPSGLFSTLHPYFGGGVGAVRSGYSSASLAGNGIIGDYATELGWQAGAGLGYDLTPNLTLALDYRHLWTNRGSFHNDLLGNALAPGFAHSQRYLANTALLSVRYSFGAAPVAAAAPSPPPPAPPPPPAVAIAAPPPPPAAPTPPPCNPPPGFKVDENCQIIEQSVVVRGISFENNSSRLTAPSQTTLEQVAQALNGQPALTVDIQGYTDSRGAPAYNLKLSQRRADAVQAYLAGKGVDASRLTAHGYGQADPMADNGTADGRAQNRRVTFELHHAPAHVTVETQRATQESIEAAKQNDAPAAHK